MIEKAIFDLDGTLLDTSPGILESVRYSIRKYGFPEPPIEELLTFVGPPLVDSYMRVCGCSREDAEKLTAAYREYYPTGPMFNARPYDGIFDMIGELKKRGLILSIATSKPTVFSSRVAARFGFDEFFSDLQGADLAGKLSKADLITACAGDTDPQKCVMVGDTQYDAEGAYIAGVPFIGVSYGFGDPEKMRKYPTVGTAERPADIARIIFGI